ncbi:hypothetical protein [Salinarimonas ramus]|uniref:Uncharacterized protein n=1 Tax=Salinarimonas ramus TaxID=690164 RepID=A0A917V4B2_9HYPH|nr:hypothetical protein [Salinarimonas ramus]GGK37807.1 hypothetical protein GCM10011322_26090 [Salinarimonas ramus]
MSFPPAPIRRLLVCGLAIAAFLAPLALHASVGEAKRQDRLPAAPRAMLETDEIAPCDARPWLNRAPSCMRAATRTEPPRLVRVITIERLAGPSTSILERTALVEVAAR